MSVVFAVYFWFMAILGQPVPICNAATGTIQASCPAADVGTATNAGTHYGNPSERDFISNGF